MTTIVAVFAQADQARQAVLDLVTSGVPREDISVVNNTQGQSAQNHLNEVLESLGGPGTLLIPEIGQVVAAGPLAATLGATAQQAGGLLNALVGGGVPAEHARTQIEGLRLGGTLIAVQSDDARDIVVQGVFRHNADPTLPDGSEASDPRPEREMVAGDAPVTTSVGALTGGMIPATWGEAGAAATDQDKD